MNTFLQEFTSTGSKIPWHRDVVDGLRAGKGVPKVAGIFITDICQHSCSFCSTANRARDVLPLRKIKVFVEQLIPLGLKAVILSGGGNPILYRDTEETQIDHSMLPKRRATFNDVVKYLNSKGLQIGLITNGLPLDEFVVQDKETESGLFPIKIRKSWRGIKPETLDRLTWIRISLSAWDHGEEVQIPDIDTAKTTLGGSWVYHDSYEEPQDRHGRVSRPEDMKSPIADTTKIVYGKDRLPIIKEKMRDLLAKYPFQYIRTLPNCYQPDLIPQRCKELEEMGREIDARIFQQYKPPSPHSVCLLGYSHPVLWPDGGVTPCDSCTLNSEANRSVGGNIYKIAQWDTIGGLYEQPVRSLIDPMKYCSGCVFGSQNRLLDRIWKGEDVQPSGDMPLHHNFI